MDAKKLFKILLGGVAVVVVLFAFGYRTGLARLESGHQTIGTLEAKLEAVDEKLVLTQRTRTQLTQLEFIQTIASEVLPDSKGQPELVGQILLIAKQNGVTISSIQFASSGNTTQPDLTQAEPLEGIPGVYTLPLTLRANGDYDDVLDMLRSIETNRRKIQTRSVNLKPILSSSGRPTTRVISDITLDVYVRP